MRKLTITLIATVFAAGPALAQPAAQNFAERFAEMQVQSGAKFPTAPIYKSGPRIAADAAVPAAAEKATGKEKKAEFADRFAEMQIVSGAKFPTARVYKSASATALAERESSTGTQVR